MDVSRRFAMRIASTAVACMIAGFVMLAAYAVPAHAAPAADELDVGARVAHVDAVAHMGLAGRDAAGQLARALSAAVAGRMRVDLGGPNMKTLALRVDAVGGAGLEGRSVATRLAGAMADAVLGRGRASGESEAQALSARLGTARRNVYHSLKHMAADAGIISGIGVVMQVDESVLGHMAALAGLSSVVVDGHPIDDGTMAAIVAANPDYCGRVEYIDQNWMMPAGCEIVALAVCLRSLGYDVWPTEIADGYLSWSGPDASVYQGSPYSDGGGLPPALVETARNWAAGNDAEVRALDLTGTPMAGLEAVMRQGYPLMVWTTEDMTYPYSFYSLDEDWNWYYPEHCVAAYGADGGGVYVSDSLQGLVKRDKAWFTTVYDACGSMAVLLLPE